MNLPMDRIYSADIKKWIDGLDALLKKTSSSKALNSALILSEKKKWSLSNKPLWNPSVDNGAAFSETISGFMKFLEEAIDYRSLLEEVLAKNSSGGNVEAVGLKSQIFWALTFITELMEQALDEGRLHAKMPINSNPDFSDKSEQTDFINGIYFLVAEMLWAQSRAEPSVTLIHSVASSEDEKSPNLLKRIKKIEKSLLN